MRRLLCALTRHRHRFRSCPHTVVDTTSGPWIVTGIHECRCGRRRYFEGAPK